MPCDFLSAYSLASNVAQRLQVLLHFANHPNKNESEQCCIAFNDYYSATQAIFRKNEEALLVDAIRTINRVSSPQTFSDVSARSMHAAVLQCAQYYLKHMDGNADAARMVMYGKPLVLPHELEKIRLLLEQEYEKAIHHEPAVPDKNMPAGRKPALRRRQRVFKPKPLTGRQTEVMQIVGECKGNINQAAKRLGRDRKTIKEQYDAALRKLGISAVQHKTQYLINDRRGQADLAPEDDRLRG